MHYAEIKEFDVANGPGVRISLFVSGCTHHCKGCFNQETWSFSYGQEYTEETERMLLDKLSSPFCQGLTLLGGEPMEPVNQRGLLNLVKRFKAQCPDKTIWCFTGYLFDEDLQAGGKVHTEVTDELLSLIDVMVDGEFKEELKDITLLYKGSSNQRTIDVPKSLQAGEVMYWERGEVSISKTAKL